MLIHGFCLKLISHENSFGLSFITFYVGVSHKPIIHSFPFSLWETMNYGFAVDTETGFSIHLDPEDSSERFSY